jgi:N-acetylneuraminic acid mutarotase
VSAGSKEGYFIKEDGTAWAMGRNDFGQLGNADTADQSTPGIIFGWKELADHSLARLVFDGVEVIDGKLYFAGGLDAADRDTFERYDPSTNQWTPLPSLTASRNGVMGTVLNDQFYAIGGYNTASSSHLSSVEIFKPSLNSWSSGSQFPINIAHGRAITLNGKILVLGGHDGTTEVSDVREYDSVAEVWSSKASMSTARDGHQVAFYNGNVWIMGGYDGSNHLNTVEIYDPATNSWSVGPNLTIPRFWAVAWVENGQLFIGGGRSNSSTYLETIELYDPDSNSWSVVGSLPSTSYAGDVAVIEDKLFLLVGSTGVGAYSNKLYVSDMQAVREIRGNSSTGHTLLVRADNSFGAMGQNNYGQLGDNSLADKSYPVSLMNTYDVVMTSGTGGSATGAGMYYAGAQVTIGASPSPGYLFGNWSGDFSSTDANDSFIINADYAIAASFSQDTEDDDDDGLNNYYELACTWVQSFIR